MNYLLIGTGQIIEEEIQNIKTNYQINDRSIAKYTIPENSINEAVEDLNTISLFDEKKLIVIFNIEASEDTSSLESYLNNPSDNILVLVTEKLDERKKITKILKQNTKQTDLTKIDFTNYIKQELKDYKIDNLTIIKLKEAVGNDFGILKQELEKLKLYKYQEKVITKEDIKKIVKTNYEYNIFDLTNAINKKDKNKIFEVYEKLILNGEDEIKLIGVLANHFRLLHQIKLLRIKKSDDDIIKQLKIHPYRFKILKQESMNFTETELISNLKELSKIDVEIKSGVSDKKIVFPIFLSKI